MNTWNNSTADIGASKGHYELNEERTCFVEEEIRLTGGLVDEDVSRRINMFVGTDIIATKPIYRLFFGIGYLYNQNCNINCKSAHHYPR